MSSSAPLSPQDNYELFWKNLEEGAEDLDQVPLSYLREATDNGKNIVEKFRARIWKRFLNVSSKSLPNPFEILKLQKEKQSVETTDEEGNGKAIAPRFDIPNGTLFEEDIFNLKKWIEDDSNNVAGVDASFFSTLVEQICYTYCKLNRKTYQSEFVHFLKHFVLFFMKPSSQQENTLSLYLSDVELFHLFSNFLDQFQPFLVASSSQQTKPQYKEEYSCFVQLFRLLFQYHDPQLSLHFDKNRIMPEMLLQLWLPSLFGKQIPNNPSLLMKLWDSFVVPNDSILQCFVAMALLSSKREVLLQISTLEEITKELEELRLTSLEQVLQMIEKGKELEMASPLASTNQMISLFFPAKEDAAQWKSLQDFLLGNIVLPLPTSEIVEAFKKEKSKNKNPNRLVKYIIIDCRSLKSFKFARLPTAVHIGPNVGYDNKKMKAILDRFDAARGSHFTIFGTGKAIQEEMSLLNIIAVKFLQSGFPHISIATGGFKDCIKYISSGEIEYVADEPETTTTTNSAENQKTGVLPFALPSEEKLAETASQLADKMKNFWSWSKQVATEKIKEIGENQSVNAAIAKISTLKPGASSTSKTQSTEVANSKSITVTSSSSQNNATSTTTATNKPKSTVVATTATTSMDAPRDAFSLEDDEEEEIDEDLIASFQQEKQKQQNEKIVKLDDLKLLGDNVRLFPCKLRINQTQLEQRYIVIGENFIMSVKAHPTMLGHGIICWKRVLRHLLKLAYHKDNNTVITFQLKGRAEESMEELDDASKEIFQETYVMDNSIECTKVIKENMEQLKKKKLQQQQQQ